MGMQSQSCGFLIADERLPFEDLFIPLVLRARSRLKKRLTSSVHALLSGEAHAGWERYLLTRMTTVGAKAAYSQFEVFKTVQSAFSKPRKSARVAADYLYREFIGQEPSVRLQNLFAEFPALLVLFDLMEKNWLATLIEFFTRLEADRRELNIHFRSEPLDFPVETLEAGLSDPHCGGRCVVRLHFSNGVCIIYKPRSVAPETRFSELIDRINHYSIPRRLRSAHCWDRGDYGWMENISPSPCSAAADVHAFYWRTGALLGLVHLARGVDMHRENLIAAGEDPVLIDLEGLYHPPSSHDARNATAASSILRTGFLPCSHSQKGTSYGLSALSRTMGSESSATTWFHINQDNIIQKSERRKVVAHSHLPDFAGEYCLAPKYEADIREGFRWIGEHLLMDPSLQGGFEDWLRSLLETPRRLILGSTTAYQIALEQRTSLALLRKKQVDADVVPNSRVRVPEFEHEAQALREHDIPYFSTTEWWRNDEDLASIRLPAKEEYLSQESVITNALLGIPQAWQRSLCKEPSTR